MKTTYNSIQLINSVNDSFNTVFDIHTNDISDIANGLFHYLMPTYLLFTGICNLYDNDFYCFSSLVYFIRYRLNNNPYFIYNNVGYRLLLQTDFIENVIITFKECSIDNIPGNACVLTSVGIDTLNNILATVNKSNIDNEFSSNDNIKIPTVATVQ